MKLNRGMKLKENTVKLSNLGYLVAIMGVLSILAITGLFLPGCMPLQGPPGDDGYTPTISTHPASYLECPTGGIEVVIDSKSTTVICDGAVGQPGQSIVGPVGPAGTDGKDATPVTLVPLCPGIPTYPTVFVEYGLCLGNQLWAVYSANGGFLALLPDGAYQSNGIGSQCNFTITGCTVTPN